MVRLLKNIRCESFLPGLLFVIGLGIVFCSFKHPDPPVVKDPPGTTIRTELGLSPEELVRNVFVAGTCDNIKEVKGLGHPDGLGYFENGNPSIGLDRGIILSTGPISYAANSNTTGDKSGDFADKTSDPDLIKLATGSIRDRVGLEFTFVPLDSIVTFRYVFASEEYCEFVGSQYNDVFGFFVRGPGINGGFTGNAKNVALIPGSEDFVSINNVNHKKNSQYYIDNTRKSDAERCGVAYSPTSREDFIEYDGFTVKLTAKLVLQPCQTYHIRIVVADVADNFYDSAVFLEAGSFDLGGQVSVQAVKAGGGPVFEGCSDGYFEFFRDNPQSEEFPMNIRIKLAESSTAIAGVDFDSLPSTITIPAGQHSAQLPVKTLNDALLEGPETVVIELDIPCACYTDGAELTITEPPDLIVELEDLTVCKDQTAFLEPEVSGGIPAYSYLWSNSSTSGRLQVSPLTGEPYHLTVTDACGHQATVSAEVSPTVPPTAQLAGIEDICEGDTATLRIDFTGTAPWNFAYSIDGEVRERKEDIHTNPYFLEATLDGEYELAAFSDAGCSGEVNGLASVEVLQVELGAEADPVSCAGGADGKIQVDLPQNFPPYTYHWENLPQRNLTVTGLEAGNYVFWATDGRGCTQSLAVEVEEPAPLLFPGIDCENIEQGTWVPAAMGGSPPYRYFLDGQLVDPNTLAEEMVAGENYIFRIEDNRGCMTEETFMAPNLGKKAVELPAQVTLIPGSEYQFQPTFNIPDALLAGVRWLPDDNLSCDDCLEPFLLEVQEGIYTIRTIDRYGCTDQAETQIILNTDYPIFLPNVFSPNGDEVNDHFSVSAHPAVIKRIVSLAIYNRWGNRIFQSGDLMPGDSQAGWDGNTAGRPAPVGVYIYHVEIELANYEREILVGDVLLVR